MNVKDKHDASSLRHYGRGFTHKPSVVSWIEILGSEYFG